VRFAKGNPWADLKVGPYVHELPTAHGRLAGPRSSGTGAPRDPPYSCPLPT